MIWKILEFALVLEAFFVLSAFLDAISAENPTLTLRLFHPNLLAIETTISGLRPLSSAKRNRISSEISFASSGVFCRAVLLQILSTSHSILIPQAQELIILYCGLNEPEKSRLVLLLP